MQAQDLTFLILIFISIELPSICIVSNAAFVALSAQ